MNSFRTYSAGFKRFQQWHYRKYGSKFSKKDGYPAFCEGFKTYRDSEGRQLKLLKKRTDVCEFCRQLLSEIRRCTNKDKKLELNEHLDRHQREAEHHRGLMKTLMLAALEDADNFLCVNTDCAAQFTLPRFKVTRHNGDYRAIKDSATRFIVFETTSKTAHTFVWSKCEGGKVFPRFRSPFYQELNQF